ncbi:hypothetical protein M1523_03340 [Patescibacteria group bacterium]|nr:hypothetical protein [Patescibacteria group bacterium]MCL5091244.1 hypothetical protein [Patescibacteria group bacterium]
MDRRIGLTHQTELGRLPTRDKLALVQKIDDCRGLELVLVRNFLGKRVFFDRYQLMYWSVWDPAVTQIYDPGVAVDIIRLPPAHGEAEFVAWAQQRHFQLQGRGDLAGQIATRHSERIAVAAIPEIPGGRLDRIAEIWERDGYPEGQRPVTAAVFRDFVRVMTDSSAPVHADIHSDNSILGVDGRIYAFDYSLDSTGEGSRPNMMELLAEMADELRIPRFELDDFLTADKIGR